MFKVDFRHNHQNMTVFVDRDFFEALVPTPAGKAAKKEFLTAITAAFIGKIDHAIQPENEFYAIGIRKIPGPEGDETYSLALAQLTLGIVTNLTINLKNKEPIRSVVVANKTIPDRLASMDPKFKAVIDEYASQLKNGALMNVIAGEFSIPEKVPEPSLPSKSYTARRARTLFDTDKPLEIEAEIEKRLTQLNNLKKLITASENTVSAMLETSEFPEDSALIRTVIKNLTHCSDVDSLCSERYTQALDIIAAEEERILQTRQELERHFMDESSQASSSAGNSPDLKNLCYTKNRDIAQQPKLFKLHLARVVYNAALEYLKEIQTKAAEEHAAKNKVLSSSKGKSPETTNYTDTAQSIFNEIFSPNFGLQLSPYMQLTSFKVFHKKLTKDTVKGKLKDKDKPELRNLAKWMKELLQYELKHKGFFKKLYIGEELKTFDSACQATLLKGPFKDQAKGKDSFYLSNPKTGDFSWSVKTFNFSRSVLNALKQPKLVIQTACDNLLKIAKDEVATNKVIAAERLIEQAGQEILKVADQVAIFKAILAIEREVSPLAAQANENQKKIARSFTQIKKISDHTKELHSGERVSGFSSEDLSLINSNMQKLQSTAESIVQKAGENGEHLIRYQEEFSNETKNAYLKQTLPVAKIQENFIRLKDTYPMSIQRKKDFIAVLLIFMTSCERVMHATRHMLDAPNLIEAAHLAAERVAKEVAKISVETEESNAIKVLNQALHGTLESMENLLQTAIVLQRRLSEHLQSAKVNVAVLNELTGGLEGKFQEISKLHVHAENQSEEIISAINNLIPVEKSSLSLKRASPKTSSPPISAEVSTSSLPRESSAHPLMDLSELERELGTPNESPPSSSPTLPEEIEPAPLPDMPKPQAHPKSFFKRHFSTIFRSALMGGLIGSAVGGAILGILAPFTLGLSIAVGLVGGFIAGAVKGFMIGVIHSKRMDKRYPRQSNDTPVDLAAAIPVRSVSLGVSPAGIYKGLGSKPSKPLNIKAGEISSPTDIKAVTSKKSTSYHEDNLNTPDFYDLLANLVPSNSTNSISSPSNP